MNKHWNMLRNAECTVRDVYHRFVSCAASVSAKFAIDDIGRLFGWGDNYYGCVGIGTSWAYISGAFVSDPKLEQVNVPTLIDDTQKWVEVQGGEYLAIAMNEKGELLGWGDDPANGAMLCKPLASGIYRIPNYPGLADYAYSSYYRPTRISDKTYKAFALGWYTVFAIGQDDQLYVWGMDVGTAGMDTSDWEYTQTSSSFSNYVQRTPLLHPFFAGMKIKHIASESYCTVVVTDDDRVFIWGDNFTLNYPDDFILPYELTGLDLTERTIVDVTCCYSMACVLLSDGTVWAVGDGDLEYFGAADYSDEVFNQIPFPEGTVITGFVLGDWSALMCWDSNNNLWGGGFVSALTGRAQPNDDWDAEGMVIICAEFQGQSYWLNGEYGPLYNSHVAINVNGDIYTWGSNTRGLLGIGSAYNDPITFTYSVTKCAPAVDMKGNMLGLNMDRFNALSDFVQPPDQGPEHEPCGHWHLREFDGEESIIANCWMIALGLNESNELLLAAAGKWWPFQIRILKFDISSSNWITLYSNDASLRAGSFGGHCEFKGTFGAYYNAKYDVTGTSHFASVYSNPRMGLWLLNNGVNTFHEFAGTLYENGASRMGITAAGLIAIAAKVGSNIVVKVSTDYGSTWNDRLTMAFTSTLIDYKLTVDNNGIIVLATLTTDSKIKVQTSANAGVTWVQKFNSVPVTATTSMSLFSSGNVISWMGRSATSCKVYTLTNNSTISSTVPVRAAEFKSSLMANSLYKMVIIGNDVIYVSADMRNTGFIDAVKRNAVTPSEADLTANINGVFVYSAFNYFLEETGHLLSFLVSEDGGEHWYPKAANLGYRATWEEDDQCDPMFTPGEIQPTWKSVPAWRPGWPKITTPKY